jgi:hypothetical protein
MAFLPPPSFEIPRPPLEPPLHGLLDTAYVPDLSGLSEEDRDKWLSGITFIANPSTCTDHVASWLPWTDDPADKASQETTVPDSVYHSVVLTYSTECQALPSQLDDRIKAAKEALIAGTGQAVEALFWGPNGDGSLADIFAPAGPNFSLNGSTPLVTGYTDEACAGILNRDATSSGIDALTPKQALLALTQALGNCGLGARGFIHAPVYLAEDWAEQGLIRLSESDNVASKLITNIRGDYVVGGSGYTGAGPNGHPLEEPADGYAWAYATGPVGILLSEPEEKETTMIDHRTNLHRIIVERTVVIAASASCLYAVYVDVS